MKRMMALGVFLFALAASGKELSWSEGVYFSGAPSYVSEFPTTFRDNGGPLSPFGSHVGLKADVQTRNFGAALHFACATGVNVLDYSRTGLFATSSVGFLKDGALLREAKTRNIRFAYYGWSEKAQFEGFTAEETVQFLGLDQYLLAFKVTNTAAKPLKLTPVFLLARKGRKMAPGKNSGPEQVVLKFAVQPTIVTGKNFLAVLPSTDATAEKGGKSGDLQFTSQELELAPGGSAEFWYIFGYHPDSADQALDLAKSAKQNFKSPDAAWKDMETARDEFFVKGIPTPHIEIDQTEYWELYFMAATALDNALYAPRGAMRYWGCVPTKVHYNWFWLWDSGFEALGYAEYNPRIAAEVIQAIFQAQRRDGFIAHMEDERARPITPHSQPPVFGFSAGQMIRRFPDDPYYRQFEKEMYEQGALFIKWWKKARDVNRNGLFEYISQDEGGWDNSPRMKYVWTGPFVNYLGTLGEVVGSKTKPLDNIDLNPWMYFYYEAMADWAEDLGKPEEAQKWKADAKELAGKIDQYLWDPEAGCWFDGYNRIGSKNYKRFKVLTPAIWFPAFAGATLDEKKARQCIEQHLLNPAEFYGKYPIPVVGYNDKYFDVKTAGWTASIWIFSAYSALEALYKFGYEKEAAELRTRLLDMMVDQDGMKGIYETYDPITGKHKNQYSTGGYASAQFGWSSAFLMEMILERYQEKRFVFADTTKFEGFVREAEEFSTRETFYRVEAGAELPKVMIQSADGKPLLESKSVKVLLSEPYNYFRYAPYKIWIKGKPFEITTYKQQIISL